MKSMNDMMTVTMENVTSVAVTSMPFSGEAVNGGKVIKTNKGKQIMLTLSDDFVVPGTPAPHWQVVDSMGNVYLLNRLMIEGNRFNKTITLPGYIRDAVKVQIWCAWAEAVLGETSFNSMM